MLEVANILNIAKQQSLLILDEIGRGTSTLDGLSIAWSIIEYVALKLNAKTLFATHYHELSELERLINGIRNYRILVQEREDGISFLYKYRTRRSQQEFRHR
jgi:DNA mismatch repair protein MutS